MGLLDFFMQIFGKSESAKTPTKNTQPKEKDSPKSSPENVELWWENPIQKNEDLQFEAVTNSVLFDELFRSVKHSRLEIIEIPGNIATILDLLNRPDFQYSEIVHLVEQSPVLMGDFISISNSAAFKRGVTVKNLAQTLPRLGKPTIQSILYLNASKMAVPNTPVFTKVAQEIITESQAVAKICRIIAEYFHKDSNEAFFAGLLHNVGKLGLLKQISNHYNLPKDFKAEYHQSIFKNIFPIFQHEAGKIIANYWKLNENIVQCISMHHKLEELSKSEIKQNDLELCALVNLAVYISRILGFSNSLNNNDCRLFELEACKILKIQDSPQTRQMLNKLYEEIIEVE